MAVTDTRVGANGACRMRIQPDAVDSRRACERERESGGGEKEREWRGEWEEARVSVLLGTELALEGLPARPSACCTGR